MADRRALLHGRLNDRARLAGLRRRIAICVAGTALPLAALVCLGLAAGCTAYQVGTDSLYSPHVRTVYVPVFESDSFRRNLGERLTEAVMKEIEDTTPYKVVSTPDADSVLRGHIAAESKRVAVENWYDDPRQVDVRFEVRVKWVDRSGNPIRTAQPIPLSPELVSITGTAPLFPEIGQSVATAQQEAIHRVAQQIVGMMENPW